MTPFRVFIGWDSKEPDAFAVLADSILRQASQPVAITPLALSTLKPHYWRPRGEKDTTEFSISRFLVPYLSNFEGYSVFMDCDMLVQFDICDLMLYALAEPEKAVFVCQHDYTPKGFTEMVDGHLHGHSGEYDDKGNWFYLHSECDDCRRIGSTVAPKKFLGQEQTAYPRKNWSSVMLLNNARCTALTPEFVNGATGLQLHRFQWLDDAQIGALPLDYNHLVGEYEPKPDAKILHWTLGGPWFDRRTDHADRWFAARARMLGEPVGFEAAGVPV